MNLNEALNTLKAAGYKLIKEADAGKIYLCYSLYGGRAHYNPENMYVHAVSDNKLAISNAITNWALSGPDDISWCGAIVIDNTVAEKYRALVGKDVADTDDGRELLNLVDNNQYEFNGTDFMDIFVKYEDEDDPAEAATVEVQDYIEDQLAGL